MTKKILTLNVKKEYFVAIKNGTKKEEYRELKPYWDKRLYQQFDEVHIKLGYPKREDNTRIIKFKWNGFKIKNIIHKHFGDKEIKVYAIDLSIKGE